VLLSLHLVTPCFRFITLHHLSQSLYPLTLTGSDPGMLKKMDPPALVLTQTDPIDR
jgi:hypothetical protein